YQVKDVRTYSVESSNREALIPADRVGYLTEIARAVRNYHQKGEDLVAVVKKAEALDETATYFEKQGDQKQAELLRRESASLWDKVPTQIRKQLDGWEAYRARFMADEFVY